LLYEGRRIQRTGDGGSGQGWRPDNRHEHVDGQQVDGDPADVPAARVHAERVRTTGTVLRVRSADGQGAGAVRVAGGTAQGAGVAGRVGQYEARRRRHDVRTGHVHDVLGVVAEERSAGAAVHAVAAILPPVADAQGRDRPAPVQKSVGRVPETSGVRPVPIRTTGSDGGAMAVRILRTNARAPRRHSLLRRRVQFHVNDGASRSRTG